MPALTSSSSHRPAAGVFVGRGLCLLGGVFALCASIPFASAQQADQGPGRSPFLPQGWEQQSQPAAARPAAAEAPQGSYVFNGMIQIGGRTLFSIGNTQTGHARLLEMGDQSGDVQVLSYDAQRNTVSLSGAGRTEELALRKSDGEPLAVAVSATPGGQRGGANMQGRQMGQGGSAGVGQNRGGPPIEFLEARRNRLNEQIERRRAEEGGSGGSGGAVTVGGGNAASNNANNAGGARAGGNTMQAGGQSQGDQGGQAPRARRLRTQMNP